MNLWQNCHNGFFMSMHKSLLILLIAVSTLLVRAGTSYNTVLYNAKNGLVSNTVYKIFIDKNHRIWVPTME